MDNLAQSFFVGLIFCSLLSDSYIIYNDILKNDYIKKKINYAKKMCDVVVGISCNNYKNDNNGNIIINAEDVGDIKSKSTNPFEEDCDEDIVFNNVFDNTVKEEVIKEEVIKEAVIKEAVIKEEVIKEEPVIKKEPIKPEVIKKSSKKLNKEATPDKNIKYIIKKESKKK